MRDQLIGARDQDDFIVHRMLADLESIDKASEVYSNLLPDVIDILIFGVGVDGHIASLFPKSSALFETSKLVVPIKKSGLYFARMTITPLVLKRAKKIFLLATGKEKGEALASALFGDGGITELPVRLLSEATWLLDSEATEEIERLSNAKISNQMLK
jgi:6-phosphogluconolactonase